MQEDSLVVTPEIISNLDITDESHYRFEWMAIVYTTSHTPEMFIPISTERNLRISSIGSVLPAGRIYVIRLRVIDNNTGGVFAQARFRIRVVESFSRGWLVMNEIDDAGDGVRMRLDMLELRSDSLLYHHDVLHAAGSQLPMNQRGRPIGIRMFDDQLLSPNRMALYILTETGSNRLSHATFMETVLEDGEFIQVPVPVLSWRPTWSLRHHFRLPGQVPDTLFAETIHTHGLNTVVAAQGNLYRMNPAIGVLFGDPINRLTGGGETFRASHHVAGNSIVFDMDSRSFRQVMGQNQLVRPIDEGTAQPSIIATRIPYQNMTNFELVTMFDNAIRPTGSDGFVYIIMRNEQTGKYWLMQSFMNTMRQDVWEELGTNIEDGALTQTRIHEAAQQERPLFLGGGRYENTFYYAVGGGIYAYDIASGTSVRAAYFPGKTVTFMRFLAGGSGSISLAGVNRDMARDMLVGIWDPVEGRGTLKQFEVRARGVFTELDTDFFGSPETNFGKIIDVHRLR